MVDAIQTWWKSPGIFEARRRFSVAVASSRVGIADYQAAEREHEKPESLPPPERDSGPDVLDGVSLGVHP